MSHNYDPTGRATRPVVLLDDGDDDSAVTWNRAYEAIADLAATSKGVAALNWTLTKDTFSSGSVRGFCAGLSEVLTTSPSRRYPQYCAVGAEGVAVSLDGVHWKTLSTSQGYTDVAFSESLMLYAYTREGISVTSNIYTGVPGAAPSQQTAAVGDTALHAVVARPAGGFIAVGEPLGGTAVILRSLDGITWTRSTTSVNCRLQDVVAGQGRYVAVGGTDSSAEILVSEDGITWTRVTTITPTLTKEFYSVCFNGEVFVAVTLAGDILYSETGYSWVVSASRTNGTSFGASVAADPESGVVVAVTAPFGQLAASFDGGKTFPKRASVYDPVDDVIFVSLDFAHGRFLAGCVSHGSIAASLRR